MTKSRNFPHKVFARRRAALARLEVKIEELESSGNEDPTTKSNLGRMQREATTIISRLVGGAGRKSTKKVGTDSGRRNF